MARKRPSVQKRQRELKKRQRELDKAEKAAQKREGRQNREEPDVSPPADDGEVSRDSDDESSGPGEKREAGFPLPVALHLDPWPSCLCSACRVRASTLSRGGACRLSAAKI